MAQINVRWFGAELEEKNQWITHTHVSGWEPTAGRMRGEGLWIPNTIHLEVWRPLDKSSWAFQAAQWWRTPPPTQETCVQSLGWEDPLEKEMATDSTVLIWESHGQRSLVGYSPWGCKETQLRYETTTNKSNYNKSPTYQPSNCKLSKMRMRIWFQQGSQNLCHHIRHERNCSSTTSHLLSVLSQDLFLPGRSVPAPVCLPLYRTTILVKVPYCKIRNIFFIFDICFLCIICVKIL